MRRSVAPGEEFDLAIRLFTHGYDVYAPNITVIYHYYTSPSENAARNISKFWDYQWGQRFPIMFRATRRLRHKLAIPEWTAHDAKADETELDELEHYGLGRRRTAQQCAPPPSAGPGAARDSYSRSW